MANKKISELPYINSGEISGNTLVPLVTYYSASTGDTVHTYITDFQTYLISGLTGNTDVFVTGGTYSAGTITFTNNTGGTFNVTGVTFSGGSSVIGDYLPLSGGTVTGTTQFTVGVSSSTISATTYQNLPTDIRVTGGTYSAGTITFTNNTGGTFNVTGFTTGSTSTLTGDFLPLSGGTVSGQTFFTSGVTITGDTNIVDPYGNISVDTTSRLLYNSGGINTINWDSGLLYDYNTTLTSVDFTNRTLNDSGGNLVVDWINLELFDSLNVSLNWSSRVLSDSIGGPSIQWQNRKLYKSGGTISFDWENGILTGQTNVESSTISATTYLNLPGGLSGEYLPLSGGTVSGQTFFTSGLTITGDTIIIDSTGTSTAIDTSTRVLVDSSTFVSVDWSNRLLYDGTGSNATVDYGNTLLYDTNSTPSVDWGNRSLYDDLGTSALEWTSTKRKLLDVTSAGAVNWNDRLLTKSDGATVSFDWENGILTGQTNIESSTISATTYLNLPSSNFTGGTVSGATNFTNGLTANTISATTYQNLPDNVTGKYLPLSGGTVTGNTTFTSGLTINYIDFDTTPTVPSPTGGTLYYDSTENALSYKPITPSNDVTVNLGQESVIRFYNNLGVQINNGQALHITGATAGSPTVSLAIGTGGNAVQFQISGIATHDVPNSSYGFMTVFGVVRDINLTGFTVGEQVYLSQTTPGGFASYSGLSFTGRTCEVGHVLDNSASGKLQVTILNEIEGTIITTQENNILASNNSSTGVFQFSGLTIDTPSGTTFSVGAVEGWIIDNVTAPANPSIQLIIYPGSSGNTSLYYSSATETYVLLTSGLTLTQQTTFPTPQQRRQNLYLGKFGHGNKQFLINAFNEPDSALSPVSQLRDMFTAIKLVNDGVIASANGVNLSFNTSAGILYGLGIGYVTNKLNPNSLTINSQSPATFQYRTQTGGTAANTTLIDPLSYDVGGVKTLITGTKATNQRIYLLQNGQIRVQYGQTDYNQLAAAVAALQNEVFVTFPNFRDNGVLIGILSVLSTCTDLSDTSKAQFFSVSKFGELIGAAGGTSTTTLQQSYNNSETPEITTNSTLGPLSVKNGAGTADNITNVFEGVNSGGTTTSYVRADGFISGNSLNAPNLIISGGTQSIFSGDSSSDLVRITQTGSGNAFVVEDITNPDSTPFVIDTSGNTGIGVTVPDSKLHISNTGTSPTSVSLKLIGTGTSEQFLFYRDGSSLINSTTSGSTNTINNGTSLRTFVNSLGFQFLDASGYGFHHTTSFGGLNVGNTNGYLYLWSQASDTLRLFLGGQDRNPTVARTRTVINPVPSSSTLFSPTGGTSIDYSFQNAGQSVFSPTGGTASYTQIELKPSYSGTGSYSGTVTGLLYNPNILSMSGTTHRAIQTTTGDVIFGSTSGNVGIGTTTPRQRLDVNGNTIISSGLTAQTGVFSSSSQNVLTVIGSGNSTTSPLFSVQGSSGELFSVTDSLVGSLFSVNDISGLPIMEVFSDNTTLWGSYQAPSLNTTTRTSLTAGTNTIYSIPTSAYTGAFYEYTLISTGTTGARAGQIMSIWSGTTANFTETSTLDIGTTTGVTFTVAVSGNNAVLSSSATTAGWTVKTIIRSI